MKAVVWSAYGSPEVLKIKEIPRPEPKENEVLVRIQAASVSLADCEMRAMKLPVFFIRVMMRGYIGLFRPKRIRILGQEVAGIVESVGSNVSNFKPGDRVFASLGLQFGGYAEYVCVPASNSSRILQQIPAEMSFQEAATLPVFGVDAYHYLKQANIKPGQHVLVNGAGGSIGTFGVQIAKAQGAEVTAVDLESKHEMLRSIGADKVIDYKQEDFTQNGVKYDVIFDVVGKCQLKNALNSLKKNGVYVTANPSGSIMMQAKRVERSTGYKIVFQSSENNTANLVSLLRLIADGKLRTIIDRDFSLEQVPAAHRYIETGNKKGHVVINMTSE